MHLELLNVIKQLCTVVCEDKCSFVNLFFDSVTQSI